jgi:hypothetical protein
VKRFLLLLSLLLVGFPNTAQATPVVPPNPILVVDKCPEFCPPSNTYQWWRPFTPRVCAQVMIPVPGKKDWFWTNSCKTNMVQVKKVKK